ncbi:MAG: acetyl-CoA carboxylase biotin carboxyl carrier protein [Phycisphaerae bacterium]|nr:acetyl-CoA carboxylase biotin carboxyl carrier protein [Phycisphaerae bacterium]
MIDIRKLKELVRLMVTNDLTELDVRDEQEQVTIKRPNPNAPVPYSTVHYPQGVMGPAPTHAPGVASASPQAASALLAPPTVAAVADGTKAIESPMVGTFYTMPGPGKSPFVQIGSKVNEDTIVCLIEAMKIFNEIKAEISGTVEAVQVKNGTAVEFGQPLFRIRPD